MDCKALEKAYEEAVLLCKDQAAFITQLKSEDRKTKADFEETLRLSKQIQDLQSEIVQAKDRTIEHLRSIIKNQDEILLMYGIKVPKPHLKLVKNTETEVDPHGDE